MILSDTLTFDRGIFFAGLGIVISLIRYGTYFWTIYTKETRPHVFSWFNWALLTGIATYAQMKLGGGSSVWVLGFVSSTCLLVSIIALFVGEKKITRGDWITFIAVLMMIPVWQSMNNPLHALLILACIDMLTYYPTVRKSWNDPWGEPPSSCFWSGLRYLCAVLAVPEFTFAIVFYPAFLMVSDWSVTIYLYWRRYILRNNK